MLSACAVKMNAGDAESLMSDLSSAIITNVSPTRFTVYELRYSGVPGSYSHYCILENSTSVSDCSFVSGSLPDRFTVSGTNNAKTLSIWLRDFEGNVSGRVDTNSVTLDTVAPVLAITSSSSGAYVDSSNVNAFLISGSCEASEEGRAIIVSATDGSETVSADSSCTSSTFSVSVNLSSLAEGSLTLLATMADLAGNQGSAASVSLTKDTVPPILASATVMNSSPTNARDYEFIYGSVTGAYSEYCILENSTLSASCSWTMGALPASYTVSATENAKVLSIWLRDHAGNISTRVDTNSVTLDLTAPSLAISQPDGGEMISAGSTYSVLWSATDSGSGVAPSSIQIALSTDNGNSWFLISSSEANDGTYSWSVPNLATLQGRIRIIAVDQAGNSSTRESASAFSIVQPPTSVSYRESVSVYLKGASVQSNTATVTGSAATSYSVSPALPAGLVFNTSTGGISGTPTSASPPGDYTVTASNAAGSASTSLRITIYGASTASVTAIASEGAFTGGWVASDAPSVSGLSTTGVLSSPRDLAVDDANDHFFVVNSGAHRIDRFVISTGAYAGWIGAVGDSIPTGGTGCTTLASGDSTPGWCTGGTSASSSRLSGTAFSTPLAIAFDSSIDSLYVLDSSSAIRKFVASTGAYVGWIGRVSSAPAGGAAGCSSTSNAYTPGWCIGGSATSHTSSVTGGFRGPRSVSAASGALYVTDGSSTVLRINGTNGAITGWLGRIGTTIPTTGAAGCPGSSTGEFTPGWCGDGSSDSNMLAAQPMNSPAFVEADAVNDALYILGGQRLSKFVLSTGVSVGWVGTVEITPTGGAEGCTTTLLNQRTPGWCTGGVAKSGWVVDGGFNFGPARMAIDPVNQFLYIPEMGSGFTHGGLQKIRADTGAHIGWYGPISSVPTGGSAGCTSATVGQITPGWCTGGGFYFRGYRNGVVYRSSAMAFVPSSSEVLTTDVILNRVTKFTDAATSPKWLGGTRANANTWAAVSDSGIDLTDGGISSNLSHQATVAVDPVRDAVFIFQHTSNETGNRIMKYTLSSGAFVGWTGVIRQTPAGGADGCATASLGAWTPGWCIGGMSDTSLTSTWNRIYSPTDIQVDSSTGDLLISDGAAIKRMSPATGQITGWIGTVSGTPTGGAAGCTTTTSGSPTPGWCTGGSLGWGTTSSGDGRFSSGSRFAVDSDNDRIFILDTGGHRLMKFSLSTGAYVGWVGTVATTPTGGAAGCTSATANSFTPGFCTGGTSTNSNLDGGLSVPQGIAVDPLRRKVFTYTSYNKISKYNADTGAFEGWIGRISGTPTGGVEGCASASGVTPGWCTGGSANSGSAEGAFSGSIFGMRVNPASGALFVGDTGNNRIQVFNSVSGSYVGWFGRAATSPTSGPTGCSSVAPRSTLPAICRGGTPTAGAEVTSLGQFRGTIHSLDLDSGTGTIYLIDGAHRLQKIEGL